MKKEIRLPKTSKEKTSPRVAPRLEGKVKNAKLKSKKPRYGEKKYAKNASGK